MQGTHEFRAHFMEASAFSFRRGVHLQRSFHALADLCGSAPFMTFHVSLQT
mgnify:CR=1 FL=1